MALTFCPAAFQQQREPNGAPTGVPHAGNSAIVAAGAASANVALPVDAATAPYQAVILTATQPAWVAFGTSGVDTVTAATPPAFLVPANGPAIEIAVPPGARFLAAIEASASAGTVSILGIY